MQYNALVQIMAAIEQFETKLLELAEEHNVT